MLTVGLPLVGALWKTVIRFIVLLHRSPAVTCNLKHSTKAKGTQSVHRGSEGNQAGFSVAVPCCPYLASHLMPSAEDTAPQVRVCTFKDILVWGLPSR